ncbi:sensor histidine kinase [Nocardiopsis dassonvillei subsp. albirubida]|uniref:histidine kinase n=1 Tax=Nocardiopsis alborubida TaxID=146802 RepID=A0A7X6MBJ8_9ACTN|nr:sensor histidine kinase [Nocardiopsis alborubida]
MRRVVGDLVLGVVLGAVSVGFVRGQLAWQRRGGGHGPWRGGPPAGWDVDWGAVVVPWSVWVGVGVLVCAVAVRRVWPVAALVVAAVGAAVFVGAGHLLGPVLVLPALVVFSAAIRLGAGVFLAWTAPLVVAVGVASRVREPWWGLADGGAVVGVVFAVGAMAFPAGGGMFVRARREARRRQRQEEVERHRYEERLRIAREVHDLVGHSLSVISMQASVALHVVDRRPEQASVALAAIRESSRSALEELRGTLAVFRGGAEVAGRGPLPGLGRVEALVGELRGAGRQVEVVWEGEAVRVPAAVDHAAFRIVQEALTNVVRHGGEGASARVRVVYGAQEVQVWVADEGVGVVGPVREGSGIAGMRERARAVGGSVTVGSGEGGGFVVGASLPLGGER